MQRQQKLQSMSDEVRRSSPSIHHPAVQWEGRKQASPWFSMRTPKGVGRQAGRTSRCDSRSQLTHPPPLEGLGHTWVQRSFCDLLEHSFELLPATAPYLLFHLYVCLMRSFKKKKKKKAEAALSSSFGYDEFSTSFSQFIARAIIRLTQFVSVLPLVLCAAAYQLFLGTHFSCCLSPQRMAAGIWHNTSPYFSTPEYPDWVQYCSH